MMRIDTEYKLFLLLSSKVEPIDNWKSVEFIEQRVHLHGPEEVGA